MKKYETTGKNKVKRIPKRGIYDKEIIYEILDQGFICHVGFRDKDDVYVIPTAYGRKGNKIFLHGSSKSRMLQVLKEGHEVCICVTHLDGIVLARSLFHSSMNYRSVVIFGRGIALDGTKKMEALKCISDQILKDRWEEARLPNKKELKATMVIELEIDSASAKVRNGGPVDDKEDYDLDIWAGVIPIVQKYEKPISDDLLKRGIEMPDSVLGRSVKREM